MQKLIHRLLVYMVSLAVAAAVLGTVFFFYAKSQEKQREQLIQEEDTETGKAAKAALTEEEIEELFKEHKREEIEEIDTESAEVSGSVEKTAEEADPGIDWEGLWEVNPDVYAWITVPGTVIDYAITYIFKYVFLFEIFFLSYASDCKLLERLICKFCNIIFILATVSLIFFLGATVLKVISATGSVYLNWYPERWIRSFWGIYFETSRGNVFDYKNSGIFVESPVYAAIVCVALTFELFLNSKKYNYLHIVVFYVTLLSTFSTTAYIYIALSFFGIVFLNYHKLMNQKIGKLLGGGIAFIIGAMAFVIVYDLLMQKKNASGFSYSIRLDDYLVAFKALKTNVIWGVGFGNKSYSRALMSSERVLTGNFGQSSDFASLLATGGIYFMIIYILGILGLGDQNENYKAGIILRSLLIYIFVVSRVGATILFMIFICGGLCACIRKKLDLLYK